MRTIKFKGKRVDTKEWSFGDLVQLHDGRRFIIDNRFGACIDSKGNFINTESPFVNEVYPETVGEFAGLTDKNNKEVYEGDITKYTLEYYDSSKKNLVGSITFYEGSFCIDNDYGLDEEIEVIGNIHDNPELLK